ncbi:MAG: hypothetical protein WBG86_16025 [Polyangiales bacterium]
MAGPGTEFQACDLGNVADGELERQFSECLHKVIDAFNEPSEYEASGHMLKAGISLNVTFSKHLETGAVLVAVNAGFKPPRRRAAVRAAFIQGDTMMVEDAVQLGLNVPTLTNVTPIDRAEGDESGE